MFKDLVLVLPGQFKLSLSLLQHFFLSHFLLLAGCIQSIDERLLIFRALQLAQSDVAIYFGCLALLLEHFLLRLYRITEHFIAVLLVHPGLDALGNKEVCIACLVGFNWNMEVFFLVDFILLIT